MKDKIVVLTGPTASGKTRLSIKLAKKFNAEIISADSRQVYTGMDIGTDKIELDANHKHDGIKHRLIDVASPKRTFTAAEWKGRAEQAVGRILKKNKLPLVVGGTAFYIEALVKNLNFPKVKPNKKLRAGFEKLSTEKLWQNLQNTDPERAGSIDPNNRVRIIRALEVALALGKVPKLTEKPRYDSLILGIKVSDRALKSKINKRIEARAEDIIKEIEKLNRLGVGLDRLINFGMEYKYYSLYLKGELTKKEAVKQSKTATWQFAKRQYTYLNRLPVEWIRTQSEAETKIQNFLQK